MVTAESGHIKCFKTQTRLKYSLIRFIFYMGIHTMLLAVFFKQSVLLYRKYGNKNIEVKVEDILQFYNCELKWSVNFSASDNCDNLRKYY